MREPTFTAPSGTGWTSFVFKCSLDNHTKCLHNRRTDHDHVPVLCGVQIVTITPYIQVIRHSHGYCMYLTNSGGARDFFLVVLWGCSAFY
jgi:hypothetical protein